MDYMNFQTPYSRWNKAKRLLWMMTWAAQARPFPKSLMAGWKRMLLRLFGAKIAPTAIVYATAKVFEPWNLVMDDHACLADGVDCYNAVPIHIGVNATVSQRVYLCTASHDISDPHQRQIQRPIDTKDRAWVCAESFVGPGVTIGEGAVVGARGCAYKDVEPWTVVGGNTAKTIKKRMMRKFNPVGGGRHVVLLQRDYSNILCLKGYAA